MTTANEAREFQLRNAIADMKANLNEPIETMLETVMAMLRERNDVIGAMEVEVGVWVKRTDALLAALKGTVEFDPLTQGMAFATAMHIARYAIAHVWDE